MAAGGLERDFDTSEGADTVKEMFGWLHLLGISMPGFSLTDTTGAFQSRAEQLQHTLKAAFAQCTRLQNICTWICFSF